jgi:hypothetical protein
MIILLLEAIALPVVADVSGGADAGGETRTTAQSAAQSGALHEATRDLEKSYAWDKTGSDQRDGGLLPDEDTGSSSTMMWIAQLLLLLVPIALGLTIAFTSLRKDLRRHRRVPYRQRGPRSIGESGDIA